MGFYLVCLFYCMNLLDNERRHSKNVHRHHAEKCQNNVCSYSRDVAQPRSALYTRVCVCFLRTGQCYNVGPNLNTYMPTVVSARLDFKSCSEGPLMPYLRCLAPKSAKGMVFRTRSRPLGTRPRPPGLVQLVVQPAVLEWARDLVSTSYWDYS